MTTDQPKLVPNHYGLGELIERLAAEPDQARRVPIGFNHPHSWRGDYWELAFEVAHDVTVGEMLADARSALGATYQGWKGGDFTMTEYTSVWLVVEEGTSTGESLGAILLESLLAPTEDERERAAYERGKAEGIAEVEKRLLADPLSPSVRALLALRSQVTEFAQRLCAEDGGEAMRHGRELLQIVQTGGTPDAR